MRRGYVPLALERANFIFAAHLPGVRSVLDGFAVGEIRVSKLTWSECHLIEKSQFMDDLQDVFFYGREPLFIVFAGYPGQSEQEVTRIKTNAVIAIERFTSALRLLKQGEVYNPLEFVLYSRHGSINTRDPRLFGRLAFNLTGDQFMMLSQEDIETLDGLYCALDIFDRFRFDPSIDRAQIFFSASFSPAHVSYAHRMLPLLAALEILAGKDLADLAHAEWADDNLLSWIDRFRAVRNALAHGRNEEPEALSTILETTRKVTRVLLREAIAWRLIEPGEPQIVGSALIGRVLEKAAATPERLAQLRVTYPAFNDK